MRKTHDDPEEPRTVWLRVLRPGLGLKRWVLLFLGGVAVAGLGIALFVRSLYTIRAWPPAFYWLTLRFLPDWARGALLLGAGLLLAGYGVWRLNRTVVDAVLPQAPAQGRGAAQGRGVMNALLQRQQRRQGPRIVAIGGGTGMPQLLRGLRAYTSNIVAIVTVADDGGSSGRLRRQMGLLPPGDFRNNIAALSEAEDLMTRVFQYRFAEDDLLASPGETGVLAGHSFGNLFIATMTAVTGSFEAGIAESSRVLAVRGRVLPSTLEQVTLCAEIKRKRSPDDGGGEEWLVVEGESNVTGARAHVERVFLRPQEPRAYPEAIRAILQADLIVACPGSFYTSLMPNLLVPAVRDAIGASSAQRIYVCNVATQPGETEGYDVYDHVAQLRRHAGNIFDNVLANDRYDPAHPPSPNGRWVELPRAGEPLEYRIFSGDLVDERVPWHHDSAKVAARLMEVYAELQAARAGESAPPNLPAAGPSDLAAGSNGRTSAAQHASDAADLSQPLRS